MSAFDHTKGNFLSIDGADIYYEEMGNKNGRPILMLHGGFGTIEDFNPVLPYFEKDFRLIAMDGRAQGKSTAGHPKLTYKQLQLDAEALLNHLKIKNIILFGFSDGGMLANRIAIDQTIPVDKMILIGTPWTLTDLEDTEELLSKITAKSWEEKFSESYALYKKLNPAVDFTKLSNDLKMMWLDDTESGGYPGLSVKKIQCPVMLIRGDNDHLVSRKSSADYADTVDRATFLNVPFATHEAHKEEATAISSFVRRFLAEN